MGFGDFVSKAGDGLGGLVHDGQKFVGKAVGAGTHLVGDALESVGLEGAADMVDDFGDRVADSLGAQVGEEQLGRTKDPRELLRGDVDAIGERVSHLRDFERAFDSTGQGLTRLDSDHWKGAAADAFRAKFDGQPRKWIVAGEACGAAAGALESYAKTVTWAQGQAAEAVELYERGTKAYEQAADAYNRKAEAYRKDVRAYNAKIDAGTDPGTVPTSPGAFQDPGEGDRKRAQDLLAAARKQRTEAARTARTAVEAATATAPGKPDFLHRAGKDYADAMVGGSVELTHFAGGFAKGAADTLRFARTLNPMDVYNITHPAEFATSVNTTATSLLGAANHPDRVATSLLGSGWGKDPSEAGGKLFFDFASGAVTGGGSTAASAAKRTALGLGRDSAEAAAKRTAVRDAEKAAARKQVERPREAGRADDAICEGGEPVDVATGRMFVDQTDVSLAGSLPLLFTRTFESGYQAGRWMGPRWVCTFDERLEIDAEGVIYLGPERVSQRYPHPVPGLPTRASAGARTDLDVDEYGDFTLTDVSRGLVREFTRTPEGDSALLTRVRDRSGRHLDYAYDAEGTPLSLTHSGGYRLLVRTSGRRITELRLVGAGPDRRDEVLVRYGYTDGHLSEVYNSSGLPMRFANDAQGRIVSWTDRNDSHYTYTYDRLGRVVDEGGRGGWLRFHFEYGEPDPETGIRVNAETNALGHTTLHHVNEHAQVVARTDPLGNTTRFERDEYDRLLAETDPLGRTTRFEYDGAGDLVAVTRPDGAQSLAAYATELSLPSVIVEAGGATWRQTYDEAGRRTTLTDPSGAVTRYAYDDLGHLASVTDALGHVTLVRCNAAGLPIEVTEPSGSVQRYERDAFGRTVAVTDALGGTTLMTWTTEGYPASRTAPDGAAESWTYDGEGNLLTHVDPLGQVTSCEYTDFETLAARTGPDGVRHVFTHDAQLQLTAVTNAVGQTWNYTYDAAGRLVAESDFQQRTVGYRLDAAGQLVTRTNPLGQRIRYTYDVLGRTIAKDAAGLLTTYAYDRAGHLLRASGPGTELVRTVDVLGNLLTETVNGRTLTHTRDALGRRTRRTTPAGHTSTWTYDAAGHPTALATPGGTLDFAYDAAGREYSRGFGGDLTLASTWNADHRLTGQTLGTAVQTLQRRGYTYRADGSLTGVDDLLSGRRTFDLDAAGRVTAVRAAGWTESYAYDPAGNLTDAHWPATGATRAALGPRTYTGTRLTTAGRIRYEYDDAGRITLRQKTRLDRKPDSWHYAWDAEDRLTAVTTPDGTRWRYLYDPFGRRTAKQRLAADGAAVEERTDFTWDGPTLAEQTTHAPYLPGPHTLSWDHKGLQPLAQTETITTPGTAQAEVDRRFFAIVTDLVGTPTELVDPATGTIAWRTTPTLWGNTTWPSSSTTYTPLRFPGQYFDPETRLHYNVHRYYDPETARYASPDPLGLVAAPNADSYVHNPLAWADPLGLSPYQESKLPRTLSDKARDLLRSGKWKEAADVHYEDQVRAITGGKSKIIGPREVDSVTDDLLIQVKRTWSAVNKPHNFLSKSTRKQINWTAETAAEMGISFEYWFKYGAHPDVRKYVERKGGAVVEGLGHN
ncbi:DUF6531 domain-containing protein [Kitasatospora sp. NBC_00240]|uniref:putative T7SS-secreted protein n=1 Tax=Kitasatospora sp. NBC_00240 TaxID=2903567 RepID=UPI00224CCB9A|nr:restriction endonuclease fold toxin [Kitasatospora sp. NBC_00240]MCX5210308.1 DUF6531 domain-containing protein [Kitasatospora sp. NBC_00240]